MDYFGNFYVPQVLQCPSRYPECPDSCQEPPLSSKDPTLGDGGQGNLDRLTEVSWQFGAR